MKFLRKIPVAFLAVLLMSATVSCRSVEKSTETEHSHHSDTLRIFTMTADTLHSRDSVYVKEYLLGDTFFVERDRWHTVYRSRIVYDTVHAVRSDTVRMEHVTETAQSSNRRNPRSAICGWVIGIVFVGTVYFRCRSYSHE